MYESIMWKYMKEESVILEKLFRKQNIFTNIKQLSEIKTLYIVAHGSSYNAAMSIAPLISELCKISVFVWLPSNFVNNAISINYEEHESTWVLGISQTGNSRGLLEALEFAKKKGLRCISITTRKGSLIESISEWSMYLDCGEEHSNAKTKGFSATLLLLILFGVTLGMLKKSVDEELKEHIYDEIQTQIHELDRVFEEVKCFCERVQYGKDMGHLYIIGNGILYGIAMEGMLKVMETMCIPTMYSDIKEFSHGMHRSVKENSYVILLQNKIDADLMNKTYTYLQKKGVRVLMLTDTPPCKDASIIHLNYHEYTNSVLTMAAVIQAISAFVPELHGQDPNCNANDDYTECMTTRIEKI